MYLYLYNFMLGNVARAPIAIPPCPLRNGPLLPPWQTSFRSLPFGLKRCLCSTLLGVLGGAVRCGGAEAM